MSGASAAVASSAVALFLSGDKLEEWTRGEGERQVALGVALANVPLLLPSARGGLREGGVDAAKFNQLTKGPARDGLIATVRAQWMGRVGAALGCRIALQL